MSETSGARAVPEVTVSMPAYNQGRFIRQALESVLAQEGVDLEVIVVDDASTDDTAVLVERIADPRVRLVRQTVNRGAAACHNVVLGLAAAAVVAHVDADDVLLPGALRRLVDVVIANPTIGQAHCHFVDIDANGRVQRRSLRERVFAFEANRRPPIDYPKRLPTSAGIINHLRTYRAAVLRDLGGFDERLRHGIDYDMALRVLERHEIAVVPEYLYCWRRHSDNTTARLSPLRHWWIRFAIRRRAIREGKVTYWHRAGLHLGPVLRDLTRQQTRALTARATRAIRRLRPLLRWRLVGPIETHGYRAAVSATRLLPFDRLFAAVPVPSPSPGRLAYFMGGFPILSETFIQREIEALEAAGMPVTVLALEARGEDHFDARAARLMRRTHYLKKSDDEHRAARRLLRDDPIRFLACRAYVTSRVHAFRKTPRRDAEVFRSAVRLAAELRARGITHLHSPWANRHAFVAMVAAALVNIPYSVQARAYDVHSEGALALDDKLRHAAFVITNTRYNAELLRARLPRRRCPPLHVVFNGIDLKEIPAALPPPFSTPGRCRLLFVGRLVEQKGAEYLLRACRILADEGRAFSCTMIGGRTPTEINHGIELRKLARSLGLDELVAFLGPRRPDQVLEFYAGADVVVLPSVICANGARDVTPNVLLEAMAMRRPVVSTTVSGIPEIVVHEETGLLVPPRDTAALAAAIARIMDAPAFGRALGEHGRARVEARFDIDKNIAAHRALFTARVGTAPPPPPHRASAGFPASAGDPASGRSAAARTARSSRAAR